MIHRAEDHLLPSEPDYCSTAHTDQPVVRVRVPAGGGTLQIQFAQTTAEASDTKILEGSMITLIDGGAY